MRGPGSPIFVHETEAADEVAGLLDSLEESKIAIKLGHIPDEDRPHISADQAMLMKRHRLDVLRVLLAKEMLAEAKEIRRKWKMFDHRTSANGLRYGDLMFSARAVLPPSYDWDLVTFKSFDGPVEWDSQLVCDANNQLLEDVYYDTAESGELLEAYKGMTTDAVAAE